MWLLFFFYTKVTPLYWEGMSNFGALILWKCSRSSLSFIIWLILPLVESIFLVLWRIKVLRKVRSLLRRFFRVVVTRWTSLSGSCLCLLDFLLYSLLKGRARSGPYSLALCLREWCLGFFLPSISYMMSVHHRDVSAMIKEFLLNLLYEEKASCIGLLWCMVLSICGVSRTIVFRWVERDPRELWSFVRFHVFLWALISKTL